MSKRGSGLSTTVSWETWSGDALSSSWYGNLSFTASAWTKIPFTQSHNIALARPIADFVVALGNDGRIISQGSLDKALKEDDQLFEELKAEVDEMAKAEQEVDASGKDEETLRPGDGKLIVAEEIGEGRVGWKARE